MPGSYMNWTMLRIPEPGKILLYADSPWRDLRVEGGSGFPGNIEPRHGDEANVLFLDGHVEGLVPATVPLQSNAPPWRP